MDKKPLVNILIQPMLELITQFLFNSSVFKRPRQSFSCCFRYVVAQPRATGLKGLESR